MEVGVRHDICLTPAQLGFGRINFISEAQVIMQEFHVVKTQDSNNKLGAMAPSINNGDLDKKFNYIGNGHYKLVHSLLL